MRRYIHLLYTLASHSVQGAARCVPTHLGTLGIPNYHIKETLCVWGNTGIVYVATLTALRIKPLHKACSQHSSPVTPIISKYLSPNISNINYHVLHGSANTLIHKGLSSVAMEHHLWVIFMAATFANLQTNSIPLKWLLHMYTETHVRCTQMLLWSFGLLLRDRETEALAAVSVYRHWWRWLSGVACYTCTTALCSKTVPPWRPWLQWT